MVSVRGVATVSGVSEQPMGLAETARGARNRAEAALSTVGDAAFGVGLESGLVLVEGETIDICACCIVDGERSYLGLSSGWALPPCVASDVLRLSHLRGHQDTYNTAFEWAGIPTHSTADGVLSYLSNGLLSRPGQMKEAVLAATLQMQHPSLYTLREAPGCEVLQPPLQQQAPGILYDTVAREWRCKWSKEGGSASVALAQQAWQAVAGRVRAIDGVTRVQRMCCGTGLDYKITISISASAYAAWAELGHAPEAEFLSALRRIEGVAGVEAQLYSIMEA